VENMGFDWPNDMLNLVRTKIL